MLFSLEHDLPEEILAAILSWCTQGSLANLCLTSKKLRRIAVPHLYSTLHLDQKADLDCPFKFLLPIAYSIFRSAEVASLIQSVVINLPWDHDAGIDYADTVSPYSEDEQRPWPRPGPGEPEKTLRKRCTDYAVNDEEAEELYDEIKLGLDENAIIPLLLASIPNLQRLDLKYCDFTEHEKLEFMLHRVSSRTKPFHNLPLDPTQLVELDKVATVTSTAFSRPIDIMISSDSPDTTTYSANPANVALIFNLPYLRSFYAWKMGDDEGDPYPGHSPFARLRPRSCAVEYIELRCSKLHSQNFEWLMNATIPGKLKTLNYEIGGSWAWCDIDHTAMMKSLEIHQGSLECLGLSHERFYPHQFDNNQDSPSAISFIPFKALRKLKAAPVYIWGHSGLINQEELKNPSAKQKLWQALPYTLEELWLPEAQQQSSPVSHSDVQFVPHCFIPALYTLLEHKPSALPSLNDLRIEFSIAKWKPDWLAELAAFGIAAESQGIACTIILGASEREDDRSSYQRKWGWNEDIEWAPRHQNTRVPTKWIRVAEEKDVAGKLEAWWEASQKT